jgi:TPR repeat protein
MAIKSRDEWAIKLMRAFGVIAAIILTLSVAAPAAAEGPKDIWGDAFAAMKRDDYPTAIRLFRALAEMGYSGAQFQLGFLYRRGDGVPQDYAEAIKWFRMAADQGHASAQSNLGFMYRDGEGVPQNYVQAHMWFNLASAASKGTSRYSIAEYRDGVAEKMTRRKSPKRKSSRATGSRAGSGRGRK